MKGRISLWMAIFIACLGFATVHAQTDVTHLYLKNASFEDPVITFQVGNVDEQDNVISDFLSPAAGSVVVKNSDGYGYDIPNWDENFDSWGRFCTAKYGLKVDYANAAYTDAGDAGRLPYQDCLNGINMPTSGPNANSGEAALVMSVAWSATLEITQVTQEIPEGRYALVYSVYNATTNAGTGGTDVVSNRFGYIDEYGVATYGTTTSFQQDIWLTDTAWFNVLGEEIGKVSMGFVGKNEGSGTQPRFIVDGIHLLQFPLDKTQFFTALQAVIDSATTIYGAGTGIEAAALLTAINTATAVRNEPTSSSRVITNATNALKAAISAYFIENASDSNPADLTSYIVNPNFDNSNTGWSRTTSATNYGTFVAESKTEFQTGGSSSENGYGDFVTNVWENWASTTYNGKMYQIITDLPNGKYRVTGTVFSSKDWSDTKCTIIYDEDGVTELSRDCEPYQEWLFLYANEGQTSVTTPKSKLTYTVVGYVNDGTLELGIEATQLVGNWFAVDNFKLEYLGYDIAVATTYLQDQITYASSLTDDVMQNIILTELTDALTQANTAVATPTKSGLQDAVIRLQEAVKAAEASVEVYATLAEAIANAEANTSYSVYPGYAAYTATVATVKDTYNGKALDADGITDAIEELRLADVACRLTQAAPFDASFVIRNSSFEDTYYAADYDPELTTATGTYNVPNYWNLTYEGAGTLDASGILQQDAPYEGVNQCNVWSPGITYLDLYQEIWLPAGIYELSAVVRSQMTLLTLDGDEYVGTQELYAAVGLNDNASAPYKWNADVFEEDWETYEAWVVLSRDFAMDEDGIVRVGVRSSGDGTTASGWFQVDDFHLTCLEKTGITSPSILAKDLFAHGDKGAVKLLSRGASDVKIYSVTGQLVKAVSVDGAATVSLAPGVYIVNKQKVIVR